MSTYPTRAPTTLACAAYRLGAVSVFRDRRGTAVKGLDETRRALRSIGVKLLEAIVLDRVFQRTNCLIDQILNDRCTD